MAEKKFTKKEVLDMLKNVDLGELNIPDEIPAPGTKRKWFKFGGYEALAKASEKIKDA